MQVKLKFDHCTGPGTKVFLENFHFFTKILVWRLLKIWTLEVLTGIEYLLQCKKVECIIHCKLLGDRQTNKNLSC